MEVQLSSSLFLSIFSLMIILYVWLPPELNPYIGEYQDNEAAASQNNTSILTFHSYEPNDNLTNVNKNLFSLFCCVPVSRHTNVFNYQFIILVSNSN